VAALILVKDQAVKEAQQSLRGDFITELLLQGTEIEESVRERGRMLGYHFDRSHQALFVDMLPSNDISQNSFATRLDAWLRNKGVWALVVPREEGIALIIDARYNEIGENLANELVTENNGRFESITVGVSQAQGKKTPLVALYRQAR